ncbi:Hypothetical protein MVR_LOCUS243 [uncultured virus]|nr:Hypothetical protein MVR_LOCUS243 [uncultured virus]
MLRDFTTEHIVNTSKICSQFKVEQVEIDVTDTSSITSCNSIFYYTTLEAIHLTSDSRPNILTDLQVLGRQLKHPRSHLFVIVDLCTNLEVDSDDDLVFCSEEDQEVFDQFEQDLTGSMLGDLYDCFKISLRHADIWKTILDESSAATLTDTQIEDLVPKLAKKHRKGSIQDKKKAIRTAIKRLDIKDELAVTGFTEFVSIASQYLKLVHQKKTVMQNYLFSLRALILDLNPEPIASLRIMLDEVTAIDYLKPDMHANLYKQAQSIANDKIRAWLQLYTNTVAVDTTKCKSNSIYTYRDLLQACDTLAVQHAITDAKKLIERELKTVGLSIATHHRRELEAVSDLAKITSRLVQIAEQDASNLGLTFDQIVNNPKIMLDNVEKMDAWIAFTDRASELGIEANRLKTLIERIIYAKIEYCSDSRRIDIKNPLAIYPSVLQVFLLSRLNTAFIFKSLYMYLTYTIRYSGRNITEQLIGIDQTQYDSLLQLESKLDSLV